METTIELPHTAGCVVCGRDNPHGLQLSLRVDPTTGIVTTEYHSRPEHIGFINIIHGGIQGLILDEAMVWAATWAGKRFCVCGELTVRYRQSVPVGQALRIEARVEAVRSRLVETSGSIYGPDGALYTTATGKYVPVPPDQNAAFVESMLGESATALNSPCSGTHLSESQITAHAPVHAGAERTRAAPDPNSAGRVDGACHGGVES